MSLPPLLRITAAWFRWRARNKLDGAYIAGADRMRATALAGPVVFAATHLSFWDGPVGLLASARLGLRPFWAMDRHNLERISFLRYLGCLPLSRDPARSREDLDGLAAHLTAPGDALWFFPQGRHRAPDADLGLKPGVLRAAGALPIVPVVFRMAWREMDRPAALILFGRPLLAPTLDELAAALDELRQEARAWADGEPLPTAALTPSASGGVERGWPARALAWITARPTR